MATVKSQVSWKTRGADYIYTLVNGVTGHVDGNISLETLPPLDSLFELARMSDGVLSNP